MAAKHRAAGNARAAEAWQGAAKQAEDREKAAQALVELSWVHPEAAE
jgi:hypothetical protein